MNFLYVGIGWIALSFVLGPIVGKLLQRRLHALEKQRRLQYWRESEAYRRLREGTPPPG